MVQGKKNARQTLNIKNLDKILDDPDFGED